MPNIFFIAVQIRQIKALKWNKNVILVKLFLIVQKH